MNIPKNSKYPSDVGDSPRCLLLTLEIAFGQDVQRTDDVVAYERLDLELSATTRPTHPTPSVWRRCRLSATWAWWRPRWWRRKSDEKGIDYFLDSLVWFVGEVRDCPEGVDQDLFVVVVDEPRQCGLPDCCAGNRILVTVQVGVTKII